MGACESGHCVRAVKFGEALAVDPKALHQGPEAFFWLYGPAVCQNERIGEIMVVHIRGPLEHHNDEVSDNYDAIEKRVEMAFRGRVDASGEGDDDPPACVVLRIDSPGGVVSGLNECVESLQRLSAEAGRPLYAYIDENSTSASYALACAADQIVAPPSAIIGSVGVISTMVDQTVADKKMGLRFVTLTSGARKSDGHPHVAISDAAVAAEWGRVSVLAQQFFALVRASRGLSIKKLKGLEAGIFVAPKAQEIGLIDAVMGWRDISAAWSGRGATSGALADVRQNVSTSSAAAQAGKAPSAAGDENMLVALMPAIAKLKAAIAKEKDPEKLAVLYADLAAYKRVEKRSSRKADAGGDPQNKNRPPPGSAEDEEEEDAEEEDEEEEEAAAKGNETNRGDDDSEDEEDDAEEDDEEEAAAKGGGGRKSIKRPGGTKGKGGGGKRAERHADSFDLDGEFGRIARKFGAKSPGALAALLDKAAQFDDLNARVAKIEAGDRKGKRAARIDGALAQRRITRHEARMLRTKRLGFVDEYLAMRPKAIVNIDEEALAVPDGTPHGDLGKEVLAQIDAAMAASNISDPKAREEMREKFISAHRERLAKSNGTAGGTF